VIKIHKLACGAILAVFAFATLNTFAQEAGLPPTEGMQPPPPPSPPRRNIDTDVYRMTKRYGLSDDQAARLRAILKDEQQKTDAMFKDDPLSPKDLVTRMKSIKDDETTRVCDILNPEQRKKYQDDVKQVQSTLSQPPNLPAPPQLPPLPGLGSAAALFVGRRKGLCLSTPERGKVMNAESRLARLRKLLLPVAGLLIAGCQTTAQMLDASQAQAIQTAENRARFEMNCPGASAAVLSRTYVQGPYANGFAYGASIRGTDFAEFTIGISGCGRRDTMNVVCQPGASECFPAEGRKLLPLPG
jgi:hypothetical protein